MDESTGPTRAQLRSWMAVATATDLLVNIDIHDDEMVAELVERLEALRPPCATCNGGEWAPCPDCPDGNMSLERMAAIVRSVL